MHSQVCLPGIHNSHLLYQGQIRQPLTHTHHTADEYKNASRHHHSCIASVSRLEDMKGKYVRVATKKWGDTVKIIGNIIKDRWFDYQSFYADKKEESK